LRAVGTNRDVTERKREEQVLAAAKDAAEAGNRAKSEFLGVVSHELRTPLTSIRGALGLLAGPLAAQLPAQARSLSAVALASSERLGRLIDDILDMEKIISGKMTLAVAAVDLAWLAAEAIERNQTFALSRRVRLDLVAPHGEVAARADPDRLHQVFANLISNAVKASPAGAAVEIAVARVATTRGKRVRVTVRDRGPGVPQTFRPRLFERFSQAEDPLTRAREGTGLGLAISKVLVEQHGGTIGHEDAPGGGALFWFALPLEDAGAQSRPA
jgi:signal transduction histidine kinase